MRARPTPTHPVSVHRARGHRPGERALQDTSGGTPRGPQGLHCTTGRRGRAAGPAQSCQQGQLPGGHTLLPRPRPGGSCRRSCQHLPALRWGSMWPGLSCLLITP